MPKEKKKDLALKAEEAGTSAGVGAAAGVATMIAGQTPVMGQLAANTGKKTNVSDKDLRKSFDKLRKHINPKGKVDLEIGDDLADMMGPHARPNAYSDELIERMVREGKGSKFTNKGMKAAYNKKHKGRGSTVAFHDADSIMGRASIRTPEVVAHELGHTAQMESNKWRKALPKVMSYLGSPKAIMGSVAAGGGVGAGLKDEKHDKKRYAAAGVAGAAGLAATSAEWDADRRAVKGLHESGHYGHGKKGLKSYLKTLGKYTAKRLPTGLTYAGVAAAPAAAILAPGALEKYKKGKNKKD